MNHTIAVTGLHSGENPQPGVGVMKSLRARYPDLKIIGLVYDVLESGIYLSGNGDRHSAASPHLADIVYSIPYPTAGMEAILKHLEYIHARTPIDVLIPNLDAEVSVMIHAQETLAARGIRMLLPTLESFNVRQKYHLPELAEECGCRTPRCRKVADASGLMAAASEFAYPMMVKGPFYGANKVASEHELLTQFYELMGRWGAPIIVQEFIAGQEFNIMAVGDGQGEAAGFCAIRKMIVSSLGKGNGGIVIRDAALEALGRALIRHLEWRGPCELEFIREEATGTLYLLEINPRFPAWVNFPTTFGCNMPALVLEELLEGGMKPLPSCEPGHFYVRHSEDLTCRVEDMGRLSSFGVWEHNV